jgi:hypothetical protein
VFSDPLAVALLQQNLLNAIPGLGIQGKLGKACLGVPDCEEAAKFSTGLR